MSFFDGFIQGFDAISCPHLAICTLWVCMAESTTYMRQALWIQSNTIDKSILREFKVESP